MTGGDTAMIVDDDGGVYVYAYSGGTNDFIISQYYDGEFFRLTNGRVNIAQASTIIVMTHLPDYQTLMGFIGWGVDSLYPIWIRVLPMICPFCSHSWVDMPTSIFPRHPMERRKRIGRAPALFGTIFHWMNHQTSPDYWYWERVMIEFLMVIWLSQVLSHILILGITDGTTFQHLPRLPTTPTKESLSVLLV